VFTYKLGPSEIGTVIVAAAEIGGRIFHRVRIGPVANRTIAEQMLSDMLSQGYDGASIVED
jgi:cell division septation protein DedD